MPVNRNALIRYRTIDQCLRNRFRQWTLEDLIDACSEALYEYEGIDKGVSKRTVQMDIQLMRSDKLGYNAPIIVVDKKFYTYQDPDYSITNIPLSDQDLGKLKEVVEILRQFKGFKHFQELNGMVQRLEDQIHTAQTKSSPIVDFEKNDNLKGIGHMDRLYQTILQKKPLEITYQSFRAIQANTFTFHPYLLKEYRNRWFVLGQREDQSVLTLLALDRIKDVETSIQTFIPPQTDVHRYFEHVIGVSVSPTLQPEMIELFVDRRSAPYVLTKPLHHSQKLIEEQTHGIIISLEVQINFELEREILGFGDTMRVLAPPRLRRSIKEKMAQALDVYQTEILDRGLKNKLKSLTIKGFSIFNYAYTKKEVDKVRTSIHQHMRAQAWNEEKVHAIRRLLIEMPSLKHLLFNPNLIRIIRTIDPQAFLIKSMYFDKAPQSNWYVTWHQDLTINLAEKVKNPNFDSWTQKGDTLSACPPEEMLHNIFTIRIHLDDTDETNGALKILPASHRKRFTDQEIQTITQNSLPYVCEVGAGGIHVMKPLLLHSSAKSTQPQRRRVIHLEFTSMDLPEGLAWGEKMEID